MSTVSEQLKSVLKALPYSDRADLVHFLVDSLDQGYSPPNAMADETLDPVLDRRLQEIKDGTAGSLDAFGAVERLRKKYA